MLLSFNSKELMFFSMSFVPVVPVVVLGFTMVNNETLPQVLQTETCFSIDRYKSIYVLLEYLLYTQITNASKN